MITKIKIYTNTGTVINITKDFKNSVLVKGKEQDLKDYAQDIEGVSIVLRGGKITERT